MTICSGLLRPTSFLVVLLALSSPVSAAVSDDDLPVVRVDEEVALPASSLPQRPIRFDIGGHAENSFAVDAASLRIRGDGVVLFSSVVLSPSGAVTVTYEGIRCASRERRSFAFGRPDGTWTRARSDRWYSIEPRAINGYVNVLYREYFCPDALIVRDAAEAVKALESGGHPAARYRK